MNFHPQTALQVIGFLYVALPFVAWSIVRTSDYRQSAWLWSLGSTLYGVSFVLLGLRGQLPDWLTLTVANLVVFTAWVLLGSALIRALGERPPLARMLGLWLLACASYVTMRIVDASDGTRVIVVSSFYVFASSWVAWTAARLYRHTRYRSAGLVSGAYLFFALALVVRGLSVALQKQEYRAFAPGAEVAVVYIASLVAALYGNLGYIGITLESSQAMEVARTVALTRELEQRRQSELRATELAQLLHEREQLLMQREALLASLAHEVRQPLNNASAALQSARAAILQQSNDWRRAGATLQRAADVMSHVTAAVDNTLADAVLLDDALPLEKDDVDIDTLIDLTLGDFAPSERERIQVVRETLTRTATMHMGLMRLALRNLLANALGCSPANAQITIHIIESEEPLALLLDVADEGPGVPVELIDRLFTRGARAGNARTGLSHGLGLYIVRRIMERHRGQVILIRNSPAGATFRVVIPQGA
ncbi:HAMP domain-containing sensor histidine kinase [Paucibacter sediminis]|uniref:histidine kinase n=1 Tax=Paucibacter sediminis TaxID=3019553 RepID=A0AA95NQ65_9BURK|nr:HAMP domain-containing sensor histidine kinase [Paucibacter sp. S2-9]WIT14156.1 HAMP domain-containing sensor histidine kinase [Paucibacter sp. S2-9]